MQATFSKPIRRPVISSITACRDRYFRMPYIVLGVYSTEVVISSAFDYERYPKAQS
jgi:hypothetical protein